jgi:uncharacterized pyridoxamine 5'-phosphate oxidase family protein
MHETPAEVAELERLLDASYARAGEHLQGIHTPARRVNATRLCELLVRVCVLDVATVSSKGEPRVAPLDGLFFHGRFVIGTSPKSLRFRQLARNAAVSAAHTRGEKLSVLVHGTAVSIDTSDPREEPLHQYFREVYGPDYDSWGFWGKAGFWRIEPRLMFAAAFEELG